MSIRLQLDVRNLSLGRRHLVNAYEVKAGNGVIGGKNCVIRTWAPCVYYKNERYNNTPTLTFLKIIAITLAYFFPTALTGFCFVFWHWKMFLK